MDIYIFYYYNGSDLPANTVDDVGLEDYTFDEALDIGSKQTPAGSRKDLRISEKSTISIGCTEWRHELMMQISDDPEWFNELLPQCKSLKDAIVEDSQSLAEIQELLERGDFDDLDKATEQRMVLQVSIIANQGLLRF